MVEGARLESEYTAKPYRGFESLRLRHIAVQACSLKFYFPCISAVLQAYLFLLCFNSFPYILTHPGARVGALIRMFGGIDADRACHQEREAAR